MHRHHPEDFLLCFRSASSRAHVAAAGLRTKQFRLILHPLSRLAGAEPVSVVMRVLVEICRITDHVWSCASANFLLSPFFLIEDIDPDTRSGHDVSTFWLSA